MKYRFIFIFIFIFFSNFLFSQSLSVKHINIKDSIIYNNKKLSIYSEIFADSNVKINNKKLLTHEGKDLLFTHSVKCLDIMSLKQKINFYTSNNIVKSYTPYDIFNFRKIQEVYNNEIPKENQIYYFSGVYFIQGSVSGLYYIETKKINGGIIKALFTIDGFNLWAQLIDSGKWNFSTGDYTELFKSYGINKDALTEKNLKAVKQIHHFFNE